MDEFNRNAREGRDPEFGRGTTGYNKSKGDAQNQPNPSLRPVDKGPFFATRLSLGDVATFAGLPTNGRAQVLREDGRPIEGLFAAGAAAASVFGGSYPGPGASLGPGVTFGYVAGRELAEATATEPPLVAG